MEFLQEFPRYRYWIFCAQFSYWKTVEYIIYFSEIIGNLDTLVLCTAESYKQSRWWVFFDHAVNFASAEVPVLFRAPHIRKYRLASTSSSDEDTVSINSPTGSACHCVPGYTHQLPVHASPSATSEKRHIYENASLFNRRNLPYSLAEWNTHLQVL